jgi:L-seryl-tRNA(Ser) seleniumtransferase
MNTQPEARKSLPAVSKLLELPEVKLLIDCHGKELVLFSIRNTIDHFRRLITPSAPLPTVDDIISRVKILTTLSSQRSLTKVINATGIIIHTNLGRAPFGHDLLYESFETLKGYSNLEFNLKTGVRGDRNDHARELLRYLTGAEDVLVVNNNAAAVMLVLRTFAKNREVIVSRGELIEIGGSFRIPEVMAASDCIMKEVGTTNRTRVGDYENAVSGDTAILFKAHKSNYVIRGFSEEASIPELVALGRKHNIPVLYDIGSGLIRPFDKHYFRFEPNVRDALEQGSDMVTFSADKLFGGPQAGIIAGGKDVISSLKKEPMLRALRVCKVTISLLETACMYYFNSKSLYEKNMVYRTANRATEDISKTAEALQTELSRYKIESDVVPSTGQFGGGSLPDIEIGSFSVVLRNNESNRLRSDFAEKMYQGLLAHPEPVLAVLKQGNLHFNILTIFKEHVPELARIIYQVTQTIKP